MKKKWDKNGFSRKTLNILDIVNTTKTGPGSKMVDRVWYFGYQLKRIKSNTKS